MTNASIYQTASLSLNYDNFNHFIAAINHRRHCTSTCSNHSLFSTQNADFSLPDFLCWWNKDSQ